MNLRRYQRVIIASVFLWALFYLATRFSSRFNPALQFTPSGEQSKDGTSATSTPEEKELVVASMARDDTSWLDNFFGEWKKNVYVVDDPTVRLTVSANKGREAMPYLTYIIDRYDSLPNVSIFIHSLRYQWHNEDPMYDGIPVLQRLRLEQVQKRGYVSLRCSWLMGCPAELHPTRPSNNTDDRSQNERAYADAFRLFFPDRDVPAEVGAHCSSQFAVSRERVREQPKSFYEKIRSWLLETKLDDQISGRVIEYLWHIIFGMPAVDCQDAGECFCQTFGLCNLTCTDSACEKRYRLPKYAQIPAGWPGVGSGENGWPERGWAD